MKKKDGVTILELMISIAVLAILLAIGIRALNPGGQFAASRNSNRSQYILSIMNAVRANIADTRTGIFTCAAGDIPTSTKRMASGAGNYDIAPCLVPDYMNVLPFDPAATSSYFNSITNYNTGFDIVKVSSTGAITISAPYAELGKTIQLTR